MDVPSVLAHPFLLSKDCMAAFITIRQNDTETSFKQIFLFQLATNFFPLVTTTLCRQGTAVATPLN